METNKVAILIDGGFFLQRFQKQYKTNPRVEDLRKFINDTISKVQNLNTQNSQISADILFRTFYYNCRPYGGKHKRPDGREVDFSKDKTFTAAQNFHNDLKAEQQMALRLGDLSFDGWKVDEKTKDYKPDFKQKSVDMKIGLDIAWMSGKRTVDKIVLVAGDSDFVSPMKFARKEGILVYLHPMGQKQIKYLLKEHADFIIT